MSKPHCDCQKKSFRFLQLIIQQKWRFFFNNLSCYEAGIPEQVECAQVRWIPAIRHTWCSSTNHWGRAAAGYRPALGDQWLLLPGFPPRTTRLGNKALYFFTFTFICFHLNFMRREMWAELTLTWNVATLIIRSPEHLSLCLPAPITLKTSESHL